MRNSQRFRQAVFTQSNTCVKPPVYCNRAVLTGFCGDTSSIQEGQRLSKTTESDKSKPEKDNVPAWITKALTVGSLILALPGSKSAAHLPTFLSQFVPQAPNCTWRPAHVRVWAMLVWWLVSRVIARCVGRQSSPLGTHYCGWDVCCHNAATLLITESKKGKGAGSSWGDVAGQWFKVFENWIWRFASSLSMFHIVVELQYKCLLGMFSTLGKPFVVCEFNIKRKTKNVI